MPLQPSTTAAAAQETATDPSRSYPPAAPPENPPARAPSWLAKRLGEWAHKHRDFFTHLPGEIMFRNIAKVVVGVIPAALAFTGNRYAFKAFNEATFTGSFAKTLQSLTKNKLFEQTAFIFGGFTVFRAFCKLWQRNYDRIFAKSEDASKAIDAIANLPGNIASDLKEILPSEIAGTAIAAFPLAAVKMGFKNPEPAPGTLKGNFAQAGAGLLNDWGASIPAYTVFFETNDRLYDDFSKGKDSPDYYSNLRGVAEPASKDKAAAAPKKWGFFTEDGFGRILFRRVTSIALGLAPFIAGQRYAKAAGYEVNLDKNGFFNNVFNEYVSYLPFVGFTVGSELASKGYDKLLEQLDAKEQQKSLSA